MLDAETFAVRWCNEFAAQMLPEPHRHADLIGRPIDELLPITSAIGVTGALEQVARTGEPYHMTTHVVGPRHEGATVRASAYLTPSREILLVSETR